MKIYIDLKSKVTPLAPAKYLMTPALHLSRSSSCCLVWLKTSSSVICVAVSGWENYFLLIFCSEIP